METELIDDTEIKLQELKIIFDCIFDLVKYYELETGQFSTIEYLCEILDEKFKDWTKDF